MPFRSWIMRVVGLFTGRRADLELDDELESHLQLHIDDNVRAGMTPQEARRAAMVKLGGMDSVKEAYRDRRGVPVVEHVVGDARFALRQLRRSPGFTATAVVVLALGMASSLSIFGFVDAALIRPLPYQDPVRLVHVAESVPMIPRAPLSYPDYLDWKRLGKSFISLDVYGGSGAVLDTPSGPTVLPGARVSASFFRTLGVVPALGRDFAPGEDLAGAPRTVVLSNACWQTRFGGRRDLVGKALSLDGIPYTVVGILPADFQFAPMGRAQFWIALHPEDGSCLPRRSCHSLEGIARLEPDVAVETAQAEMQGIARQLERTYPDSNRGQGASVVPLSEVIVGRVRPILIVLLAGAGLLLAIAGLNVISLLLVRAQSRRREMAVRGALGASPSRLVAQFAIEGVLLVAVAMALGLLGAQWGMQLLSALIPTDMFDGLPFLRGLGLNAHVLWAAAAIGLAAVALFAVAPLTRTSLADVRDGLTEGSRGSASTAWRRLGTKLVVVELATAMVLLAGAGLLGRSLFHLLNVNLSFEPRQLATLRVAAAPAKYSDPAKHLRLARDILRSTAAVPGVRAVALTSVLPVSFNGNTDWIRFVGRPYNGEHNEVNERDVSGDYFRTLQARLVRGRTFTDNEDGSKPKVVVINQALARKYYGDQDPVGSRFGDTELTPDSIKQVIGVVDDIREGPLDADIWPAVYYPFTQSGDTSFNVVVRTEQDEHAVLPGLGAAIRTVDPDLGIFDDAVITERIATSPTAYLHRSTAWLVGGFAGIAVLLGAVGLYGVMAYLVSQRTREIGVRIALGAQRASVYRMVLFEAAALVGTGILLGLAGALACATLMRDLLFGIPPWDVPTMAMVAVTLAGCAAAASYVPARRAAAVDPIEALRVE